MKNWVIVLFLLVSAHISAQNFDLSYYLPAVEYDRSIPTPKEFLGHEVGEMHVTHDKLYYYAKELARLSDRIDLTEYARSHEKRPLVYLTITSPANHSNIEKIKADHKKLTNTSESKDVNIDNMPIIIYQGNSIHGNEPSGANGALATMYYLAAAKSGEINDVLNNAIILFDPSLNPDGLQRFSTWANTHRGKHLISDPVSREFNEAWPSGRTNHYWFDLNRDWLLLTHPESQGRIRTFHEWKPDILTDHHEMGTNSTFFFQPGIPSRTNPNTPKLNQELTAKIGDFHGAALDKIGSLYYAKESFDDYYYGKGSTYPDAQGCIGILFEQASSRGHLQQSDFGMLSFPFTIRNQVTTMLSTQRAGVALRKEILNYKKNSFIEARQLAKANPVKAYAFGDAHDPYKVSRFIEILLQHQIEIHQLKKNVGTIASDQGYVVSLDQDQYRLTKSIFEKVTQFEDSLFYDVSAWTMPLAFDIPYTEIQGSIGDHLGTRLTSAPVVTGKVHGDKDAYAYLVEWDQYLAPRLLKALIHHNVIVQQANESFTIETSLGTKSFGLGTLIIPTSNNQKQPEGGLHAFMEKHAAYNHLPIYAVKTGMVIKGVNLGSRTVTTLKDPKPLMVIGPGVSSYDAGELWHHLDQILEYPVPMVDADNFNRVDLTKYNTLILPDGNYGSLNGHADRIKAWAQSGGNIVAMQGAVSWLKAKDIIQYENQTSNAAIPSTNTFKRYADAEEERGSRVTGGMIAMMTIDKTHPLFYGYHRDELPIFKTGNQFLKPTSNVYGTPAKYSSSPVLSGYIHRENVEKLSGAAAVFTQSVGRGRVVVMVDNPVFRGYWWGANKLFANALFLTQNINY